MKIVKWWPVLTFLVLVLVRYWGVMWGLTDSGDFLMGYPINQWIYEGGIKTWCPYIYGGVPIIPMRFLNVFYFVGLYGIKIMVVHVFLACVGMWLYLGKGWRGWFGGVAYGFTGLMTSLVYAGHDGKMMVMAYFPWILWCLDRITWKWAIFLGILGWLCLSTGHVQMSYYVFVFSSVYFLCNKRLWGRWREVLLAVAVAVTLWMPQYMMTNKVVKGSTRGEGSYERAISYSMPPEEVMCTIDPSFKGELGGYEGRKLFKQHTEFMGAIVVVLGLIGLYWRRWDLMAVGVVSLIFSFGGYTPLYKLIYMVPPNGMFRSPSMAFFGFVFAVVVSAGETAKRVKWGALILGLVVFVDLWTGTNKYVKKVEFEDVYGNVRDVAEWMQKDTSDYRIFTPDDEIADNRFMLWRIKSINGHWPFPRKEFADSVGTHGILPDYHKTDLKLLREMNVKYVVSKQNFPLRVAFTGKEYKVYFTP